MKKKIVGFNFLHQHPGMQTEMKIDDNHVIVDKKQWEEVVDFFNLNMRLAVKLGEKPSFEEYANRTPQNINNGTETPVAKIRNRLTPFFNLVAIIDNEEISTGNTVIDKIIKDEAQSCKNLMDDILKLLEEIEDENL